MAPVSLTQPASRYVHRSREEPTMSKGPRMKEGTWIGVEERLPEKDGIYSVHMGEKGDTPGMVAKMIYRVDHGWSPAMPPPFGPVPGEVLDWLDQDA